MKREGRELQKQGWGCRYYWPIPVDIPLDWHGAQFQTTLFTRLIISHPPRCQTNRYGGANGKQSAKTLSRTDPGPVINNTGTPHPWCPFGLTSDSSSFWNLHSLEVISELADMYTHTSKVRLSGSRCDGRLSKPAIMKPSLALRALSHSFPCSHIFSAGVSGSVGSVWL